MWFWRSCTSVKLRKLKVPGCQWPLSKQINPLPAAQEFELDHDDPDCVDLEDLHNPKAKKAALEALGRPVNLDDEMDL